MIKKYNIYIYPKEHGTVYYSSNSKSFTVYLDEEIVDKCTLMKNSDDNIINEMGRRMFMEYLEKEKVYNFDNNYDYTFNSYKWIDEINKQ